MGLSGYFNNSEDDLQPVDAADEEEQQRLRLLAAGPPADKPAWWKPPTDIPAPRPIEDAVAPESPEPPPDLPSVAAAPAPSLPPGPMPVDKNVQDALARRNAVFGNKPVAKDPKWWQRALAGAAGFGAGYYNAEGKAGHIDPSAAIDAALGGPGNRKREDAWKHNVQTAELGLQGAQGEREAWFKKNKEEADQRLQQAQETHLGAQTDMAKATAEATRAGTKDRYLKVGDGVFDKKLGKWAQPPVNKNETIEVNPEWAKKNLPMLVPDPEDGVYRVPVKGLDSILSNVTKKTVEPRISNPQEVLLNPDKFTPEQVAESKRMFGEMHRPPVTNNISKEKEDRTVVYGTEPQTGRTILVPVEEAKSLGLTGVMAAPTADVSKALSARQWLPLAEAQGQEPDQMGVLQIVDELDKRGLLGPVASRWNDFLVGKFGGGTGNQENDRLIEALRTKLGLSQTLLMNLHVGSRGGAYMLEHFEDLANAKKLNANILRTGIRSELNYAKDRAMIPSGKGGNPSPQHAPSASTQKTFTQADVAAAVAAHPGMTAQQIEAGFLAKGWVKR